MAISLGCWDCYSFEKYTVYSISNSNVQGTLSNNSSTVLVTLVIGLLVLLGHTTNKVMWFVCFD